MVVPEAVVGSVDRRHWLVLRELRSTLRIRAASDLPSVLFAGELRQLIDPASDQCCQVGIGFDLIQRRKAPVEAARRGGGLATPVLDSMGDELIVHLVAARRGSHQLPHETSIELGGLPHDLPQPGTSGWGVFAGGFHQLVKVLGQ